MRKNDVQKLIEDYRESCNSLTARIETLNEGMRFEENPFELNSMSRRVRYLREERLALLKIMENLRRDYL